MRAIALLAIAVLTAVGVGVAVEALSSSQVPPGLATTIGAPMSPRVFYGEWYPGPSDTYVIEQFATSNGAPLRKIANLPRGVSDLSRGPDNSLWWSVGSGPTCPANTPPNALECYPVPNTCRVVFQELRIDGRTNGVVKLPDSVDAGSPAPSPRGDDIAFVAGPCTSGPGDPFVVVDIRDLRTGAQWSVGRGCDDPSTPAWNPSGTDLVVVCAGAIAVGPAGASSPTTAWSLVSADPGCRYTTAVFDAWGVVGVESCGANDLRSTYLVQLGSNLTQKKRYGLAPQSNPTTLSVSPSGKTVLIDEYESDPGNSGVPEDTIVPKGDQPGPYIWVETFDGKALHIIRRWGNISVNLSSLTW